MLEHGGPEVLRLQELERPVPAAGEVLLETRAAGLNPVDTQVRSGSWLPDEIGRPPMVLGWDVAGLVTEIGAGVRSLEPGDRAFGMPAFPELARCDAEYVVASERHVLPVPAGLTDEQAGGLPLAGLTAWQALVDGGRMRAGDRVLVMAAAGGVGHLAVQIAKARGAHVIGTARREKHDFLSGLGADEAIEYTDGPIDRSVSDLDVVLDLVSEDDDGLITSLATLRPGGRLVVIAGTLTERVSAVAGQQGKLATEMLVVPDRAALQSLASLADAGRLTVHVDAAFPLEQAADAHRRQESGRVMGKLLLTT